MLKGQASETENSTGMKKRGDWKAGSGTRSMEQARYRRTADVWESLKQQVGLLVQIELTLNFTGR